MEVANAPYRVLFVCWGNICRSPAGENIFRSLVAKSIRPGSIECDSAGTIDAHTGKDPDARMRETLARRGIEMTGKARQIRGSDLDRFDIIVTMDDFNREEVLALTRSDAHRAKIVPLLRFADQGDVREVPDPYYGGDEGFTRAVDLIEDGCRGLLADILSRLPEK